MSSFQGTFKMVQSLRSINRNILVNDVVLIVEHGLPRNQWLIGRVIRTISDNKGVVRQALMKTKNRELVRPIVKLCFDPQDLTPLTPNSFLIQRSNQELPLGVYRMSSFQGTFKMVQSLVNEIWKRWQEDYLPGLITRAKWRSINRNILVNDLVLIVEQGLPRNQWLIGRVIQTISDNKGVVRQAPIKTKNRELVRPIVKLY
ncbi:hypothetical protein TCAL_12800, partial [Tigriopus californicus]|eukprot:TCALIF_12800-PA protein Name:"Protein of unknown function" AED:0.31 eAED:0.40 QI:85/0/0/1/0/0/3/0/201